MAIDLDQEKMCKYRSIDAASPPGLLFFVLCFFASLFLWWLIYLGGAALWATL